MRSFDLLSLILRERGRRMLESSVSVSSCLCVLLLFFCPGILGRGDG